MKSIIVAAFILQMILMTLPSSAQEEIEVSLWDLEQTDRPNCAHCYNMALNGSFQFDGNRYRPSIPMKGYDRNGCLSSNPPLEFNLQPIWRVPITFFPKSVTVEIHERALFGRTGCNKDATTRDRKDETFDINQTFFSGREKTLVVRDEDFFEVEGYRTKVRIKIPKIKSIETRDISTGDIRSAFCEGETVQLRTEYQSMGISGANYQWQYRYEGEETTGPIYNIRRVLGCIWGPDKTKSNATDAECQAPPVCHYCETTTGRVPAWSDAFTNNSSGERNIVIPPLPGDGTTSKKLFIRVRMFGNNGNGLNPGNDLKGPWSAEFPITVYPPPPSLAANGLNEDPVESESDRIMSNNDLEVVHSSCSGASDASVTIKNIDPNGIDDYFLTLTGPGGTDNSTIINGAFPETFSTLDSGRWTLKIQNLNPETSQPFGCFSETIFTVQQPAPVGMDTTITSYAGGWNVSCFGNEDGQITVEGTGGYKNYRYDLKSDESGSFGTIQSISDIGGKYSFRGLKHQKSDGTPINYKIEVIDAFSCSEETGEFQLAAPPPLLVQDDVQIFKSDYFGFSIECFDQTDQFLVLPDGGTPPYSFSISGGGLTDDQFEPADNQKVFTNIPAGIYAVRVVDRNNCEVIEQVTMTQPDLLDFETLEVIKPACFGANTASIRANALGGVPLGSNEYVYTLVHTNPPLPNLWPEGFDPTSPDQTAEEAFFDQLISGTYEITITDRSACQQTYEVIVTEPLPIHASVSTNVIVCYGDETGMATLQVDGGTFPYAIQWLDAFRQEVSSESLPSPGTVFLDNVAGGQYYARITDDNGCVREEVFVIPEPATPLDLFVENGDVQAISCIGERDGQVFLQVSGGWQPYLIGDSGTNLRLNQNLYSNLTAGVHRFYVQDFRGCLDSLDITIAEPEALIVSAGNIEPVSCNGFTDGSIEVIASGGTAPYEYYSDVTGWITDNILRGFGEGTHDVIVRDASLCEAMLTIDVPGKAPIVLSVVDRGDTQCGEANGFIDLSVAGGTPDYTFEWRNQDDDIIAISEDVQGLFSGIYRVMVTDANLCETTREVGISDSDGPQVSIIDINPVSCFGDANGSAEISVTEANGSFTIQWSDGQTGVRAEGLTAGIQLVSVEDEFNCLTVTEIDIPTPQLLEASFENVVNPFCNGDRNGTLEVVATGGTAPYSYEWISASGFGSEVFGIGGGTHEVIITDFNGCTLTATYELEEPPAVAVDLGGVEFLCLGQSIILDAGNPGASYQWRLTNGLTSTERTVEVSQSGIYSVTVTDARGCQGSDTFELVVDENILVSDFVAATEVIEQDTVVFVDVTFPIPDSSRWVFPEEVIIYETTPFDYRVIFPEAGVYTVTLNTYKGDCVDGVSKRIFVNRASEGGTGGRISSDRQEDNIINFNVYPNPSNGRFSTEVLLSEPGDIEIILFNVGGNTEITSAKKSDSAEYIVDFELPNILPGIYLLHLKAPGEEQTKRIFIQ